MKDVIENKIIDINKLNKNLLEQYIKTFSNIANQNKNINTNSEEEKQKEKLLIYVLTYNINGKMPSENEIPLLFPKKEQIEKFDIFVINTQECLRSIKVSLFINSKEDWEQALSKFFGDKFFNIINSNLGALHISIFIKKENSIYYSDLRCGEIKTGFLNIMANKGAVSASMKYYDKHILFVCCHLAAGHENGEDRNNDLSRIGNSLYNSIDIESGDKLKSIQKSILSKNIRAKTLKILDNKSQITNMTNKINNNNHLKTSLTYKGPQIILNNENENEIEENENDKRKEEEKERLNSTNKNDKENAKNEEIIKNENEKQNITNDFKEIQDNKSFSSNKKENDAKDKLIDDYDFVIMSGDLNYRLNIRDEEIYEIMNNNDPDLLRERDQLTEKIKKQHNLKEGVINFMPTYKFKNYTNEYDYSRKPGWTDRILYKSKRYYDIMLCEYSSLKDLNISDHKPVYAVFKINFKDKKIINDNSQRNEQECCIT